MHIENGIMVELSSGKIMQAIEHEKQWRPEEEEQLQMSETAGMEQHVVEQKTDTVTDTVHEISDTAVDQSHMSPRPVVSLAHVLMEHEDLTHAAMGPVQEVLAGTEITLAGSKQQDGRKLKVKKKAAIKQQ